MPYDALEYDRIPPRHMDSLELWIAYGIEPGDFLVAVLSNDLRNAVRRADERNLELIPIYVNWLTAYAPMSCWGSPAAVESWAGISRIEQLRLTLG
jgi:hypothetical protein